MSDDIGNDRALAKRFYSEVTVARRDDGAEVLLDGRSVRTPAKADFVVPAMVLAEAIAEEWRAQGDQIDPRTMPLTKLANTAIDGVSHKRDETIDAVMAFAASDLICYRAEQPDGLVMKQMALWGPVIDWLAQYLGARFEVSEGVMHVEQPEESLARVREVVETFDAYSLTAFHTMASLMGSTFLALAHVAGLFDLQATWTAAHVDEDWQISQWGQDEEAAARRAKRWEEMEVASRMFAMLKEE